jgi:hypothetical protein
VSRNRPIGVLEKVVRATRENPGCLSPSRKHYTNYIKLKNTNEIIDIYE